MLSMLSSHLAVPPGVLSVLRGEPKSQPLQVGNPCPISAPRQCRQCLDSPCPPSPSSPRDTQMETNCTRQFGSRSPSRAIGLIFTSVAGRVDGCESSPRRSVSRCGLCLVGLRRRYALIDSIKGREHRENGLVSEQRAARRRPAEDACVALVLRPQSHEWLACPSVKRARRTPVAHTTWSWRGRPCWCVLVLTHLVLGRTPFGFLQPLRIALRATGERPPKVLIFVPFLVTPL